MKKNIAVFTIIILNLILSIILLTKIIKIEKSVWDIKWDVSSIDSSLNYVDDDIKDIKENIDDIKDTVDDIEYYLQ